MKKLMLMVSLMVFVLCGSAFADVLLTDSSVGGDWLKSGTNDAGGNGTTEVAGGYDGGDATDLYTNMAAAAYYSIWANSELAVTDASGNNTLEAYLKVPTVGYTYVFVDLAGVINDAGDIGFIGFRVNSAEFTDGWEKYSYNFAANVGMVNDVASSDVILRTSAGLTAEQRTRLLQNVTSVKISVGHGWIADSMYVDDIEMVYNAPTAGLLMTDCTVGSDWVRGSGSGYNGTTDVGGGYDSGDATSLETDVPYYSQYYSIWTNSAVNHTDIRTNDILEAYLKVPASGYTYVFVDIYGYINYHGEVGHIGFRVNAAEFTGSWEKYSFNFGTSVGMVNDVASTEVTYRENTEGLTVQEREYLRGHVTSVRVSAGHGWINDFMYVDDIYMVGGKDCSALGAVSCDLDGDCDVDFGDFVLFAEWWLF